MRKTILILILITNTLVGVAIGYLYERNHWLSKELYAVYDRENHLDKCTRDFDLVFRGLKEGHKIVAGNRRVTW